MQHISRFTFLRDRSEPFQNAIHTWLSFTSFSSSALFKRPSNSGTTHTERSSSWLSDSSQNGEGHPKTKAEFTNALASCLYISWITQNYEKSNGWTIEHKLETIPNSYVKEASNAKELSISINTRIVSSYHRAISGRWIPFAFSPGFQASAVPTPPGQIALKACYVLWAWEAGSHYSKLWAHLSFWSQSPRCVS